MTNHDESMDPVTEQQVTLRSPAELADALPYLLGFTPDDSIVLVAVHGDRGRFGGRLRIGIPAPDEWPELAEQIARCLISGSEKRAGRPEGIVAFLCQDPRPDETGQQVVERLRPLAQLLRTACGALDVPVPEALCISAGRYWSYCCPDPCCCPPEGVPMTPAGTSVMAAAATYAGVRVRGTLREMEARLSPRPAGAAREQEQALDRAGSALVPRILSSSDRAMVAEETLELAARVMERLRGGPPAGGGAPDGDRDDDSRLTDDEAARLILGLQDRTTRDRAAEWMEGEVAGPALRLWRTLARRCAGPYAEHAAAPLTLAGWVAWSAGDEPEARVAFGMALRADPGYRFAQLLHHACNEGLDPEDLRRCLRQEREDRTAPTPVPPDRAKRGRPARTPAGALVAPPPPGLPGVPGKARPGGSGGPGSSGGPRGTRRRRTRVVPRRNR